MILKLVSFGTSMDRLGDQITDEWDRGTGDDKNTISNIVFVREIKRMKHQ